MHQGPPVELPSNGERCRRLPCAWRPIEQQVRHLHAASCFIRCTQASTAKFGAPVPQAPCSTAQRFQAYVGRLQCSLERGDHLRLAGDLVDIARSVLVNLRSVAGGGFPVRTGIIQSDNLHLHRRKRTQGWRSIACVASSPACSQRLRKSRQGLISHGSVLTAQPTKQSEGHYVDLMADGLTYKCRAGDQEMRCDPSMFQRYIDHTRLTHLNAPPTCDIRLSPSAAVARHQSRGLL